MNKIFRKLGNIETTLQERVKLIKDPEAAMKHTEQEIKQREDEAQKEREVEDKRQKQTDDRRRRLEEVEQAALNEPSEIRTRYGHFRPSQLVAPDVKEYISFESFRDLKSGTPVSFRARLHTKRAMSSKLGFFLFRQQTIEVQAVLAFDEGRISENMLHWALHLPSESIVVVSGILKDAPHTINAATFHDLEVHIDRIYALSQPTKPLPYSVYRDEAARDVIEEQEEATISSSTTLETRKYVSDRHRLENRILDLREPASLTIFRINAAICSIFRSFLDSKGFIEIHTPKLQGGATESGASVFEVNYFGRKAFLAQSPQLAKQMAMSADFGRVYEIGPVFRAENSNTHRHLTEYTGLDLEMSIEYNYDEMLDVVDEMFKTLWKGVYDRFENDMHHVEKRFPHQKLVWLEKTPRIPFREGIQMLRDSGWTEDDEPPAFDDDLSTRGEIRLGELVKEKYGTDYYILDKFPASARPFYTMPDSADSSYTNSFDIMLRGQEILSGGQRVHDLAVLEKQMRDVGIHPESLDEYMEAFRLGAPPHAGAGIGLERVLMLLLDLGDVRWASFAHRDPRSLPTKPKLFQVRHPDANTLELARKPRDRTVPVRVSPPPLEKLIANYGDAANTSWLDERYHIWRHPETGAAQGYVPSHSHAIVVGEPLCDRSQLEEVLSSFLKYVYNELKLKPIWILVGSDVEDLLARRFEWRTMTCVAENRARVRDGSVLHDPVVRRKLRHAEREGVKISNLGMGPSAVPEGSEVRKEIEERIEEWVSGRQKAGNGKQVRLTEVRPWVDMEHRMYLVARDTNGRVCALVVLHQLSLEHGFQIKWALDFHSSPSGTIESIVLEAMDAASDVGAEEVSFGTSATAEFSAVQNMSGVKVKILGKLYKGIAESLRLTQKGEFRAKMGAREDPVYLCYPANGMGPTGVKALLDFFGAND